MRLSRAIIIASLIATPAAAFAQAGTPLPPAASTAKPGDAVFDSTGAAAGTIDSVTDQAVIIAVSSGKVAIARGSLGKNAKGYFVTIPAAQLQEAAAQQAAQAQGAAAQLATALVPGAKIYSRDNAAVLGTVKTADATTVTLTTVKGDVALPRTGFGMGPSGPILGFTAAEFATAIGAN